MRGGRDYAAPMRWIAWLALAGLLTAPATRALNAPTNLWEEFAWPVSDQDAPALAAGQAMIRTQNWAQALTLLENRLFEQPADAGALHLAGLLFWQAGNREEATRRLVRASRAPAAQPITLWTLAALSSQARSQAEAVGWIKRASRVTDAAQVETWLRNPHFSGLCEFPPYRELLVALDLRDLCPSTDLSVRYDGRRTDPDEMRELLDRPGPISSLRLSVQESPAQRLSPLDDAAPSTPSP